jgi:hypothetical protein
MAELAVLKASDLPASIFGRKKRLVMVHIGRELNLGYSENGTGGEILDLQVD